MPALAPSAMPIRPTLAWAKTAQDNPFGTHVLRARGLAAHSLANGSRCGWTHAQRTSAAAALRRELSWLSDAELERRGIPRGELTGACSRRWTTQRPRVPPTAIPGRKSPKNGGDSGGPRCSPRIEDKRQSVRNHHGTTRGLEVTVTTEVGPQRFGQPDPAV